MVHKFWALILTIVLLLSILPVTGMAATDEEIYELRTAARESYLSSLGSTGKESLRGYCGLMVSHQLYHMGINNYVLANDGNKQYDTYSQMLKTSGGYYVSAYSAEEYSLKEALNLISHDGTKDVYNILVGFEWTDTVAGGEFGHACVINGILNGKVYFVESYYTRAGGAEGNVATCSIDEFVAMFEDWTVYEGLVHFGGFAYADAFRVHATDIFVRTRFSMELRSQPCPVGQEDCKVLRSLSAGERLRVTGVLKNTHNEWFYRVIEGDQVGYVVAQTTVLERTNVEDLTLDRLYVGPDQTQEAKLTLEGTVRANNSLVGAVEVVISDANGKPVLRQRRITDAYQVELESFREDLALDQLPEGVYTVTVLADTAAAYINKGELDYSYATRAVGRCELVVGDAQSGGKVKTETEAETLDGWYWKNGTWYLYRNNQTKDGWVQDRGVRYYLQKDGSVTRGWAEIDGKNYFFTDNGALCVGWLETENGLRYMQEDGGYAVGWKTIGGSRYYFNADGQMQTQGTRVHNAVTYRFQSDGRAVAAEAVTEK